VAGKVFHVTDETHAAVKVFCEHHSIQVKPWVEAVLNRAIECSITNPDDMVKPTFVEGAMLSEPRYVGPMPPRQTVPIGPRPEPVPKKPIEVPPPETPQQVPPYERPPFWANRDETEKPNGS
jgi:hypothetical protein